MESQGKRKRESWGEEEESLAKKPRIEPIPVELMEMIWVGHLTPIEREEGLWALLLVYRMVSQEWYNQLAEMWRAACENIPRSSRTSFPRVVARFGWLPLLPWAIQQGWAQKNRRQVLAAAARGGHIEIMEWIGTDFISSIAVSAAVEAGNMEALRWCIRYVKKTKRTFWWQAATHRAALVGHLPMLQQLVLKKACQEPQFHRALMLNAASKGLIEAIKWFNEELHLSLKEDLAVRAGMYGHIHLLQWLHVGGCNITPITAEAAARARQIPVLKWLVRVCHVPLYPYIFADIIPRYLDPQFWNE